MSSIADLFKDETTEQIVERAHQHIADLCSQKARWTMSIPPRGTDSDLLLTEALDRLEAEAARSPSGSVERLAQVADAARLYVAAQAKALGDGVPAGFPIAEWNWLHACLAALGPVPDEPDDRDRGLVPDAQIAVDAIGENQRLREALERVKRFSEAHHGDQGSHLWLHALLVDIPSMVDTALGPAPAHVEPGEPSDG